MVLDLEDGGSVITYTDDARILARTLNHLRVGREPTIGATICRSRPN